MAHAHATGGYASAARRARRARARSGVESLRDVRVDDLARAAELLDDETFRRVRHIVTENQRVLDTVRTLREHGPGAIGPLLDASHVSMRDDFEISVPELDLAVETAQGTGAIGARMTGGGFGGSAIALVIDALVPVVTREVVAAFAEQGLPRAGRLHRAAERGRPSRRVAGARPCHALRGHADASSGGSTARGTPPVMRTSSSNDVGKTVFAWPAAAHTTG